MEEGIAYVDGRFNATYSSEKEKINKFGNPQHRDDEYLYIFINSIN